ncbi:MAG: SDR family NAD(P)-dependent oxidoreductase, partial [Bdellovibrionia bacterium]
MTKRCVITGAGRGIGLEWARVLLTAGHTVVAASRTVTPELESLVHDFPAKASAVEADVTSNDLKKKLGEHPLLKAGVDLVINNAGIMKNENGFTDLDLQFVRDSFEVNTLGPMRVAQALLPKLKSGTSPVIVNITSLMGSIADN